VTIIFFGSDPWFSQPVLEALLKAEHEVPIVITKGEAMNKFKTIQAKTEEDILRFTIYDLRFTNGIRPDAIVLAAFGPPFLPTEVLNWPKYGCLNVHASLLPRWRGASPVFGAIANGDKETGVSIMKMTEEIDLGPVLGQKSATILQGCDPSYDNRESLTRRLEMLGGELIVETLKKIENGQINEVKQPSESPTPYTHRLTKDSGRIDWKRSPTEIERFIRAVTPWPGAVTSARFKIHDSRFMIQDLKILKAHLGESPQQQDCHTPQSGVRNDEFLIIDEVQLPGKNPISWKAFLAGHPSTELI
jgi:methionyl-tRNA formyltransferase